MRYTERRRVEHPLLCVAEKIRHLWLDTDNTNNDQAETFSDPGIPDLDTRDQQFGVDILTTLTQLTSLCLDVWMLGPGTLNAINSLTQLKVLRLEARNVTDDFLTAKSQEWIQGNSLHSIALDLPVAWRPELLDFVLQSFGDHVNRLDLSCHRLSNKAYRTRSTRKFSFPSFRELSIIEPCTSLLERFTSSPLNLLCIGDYFKLETTAQAATSIAEQSRDLVQILSVLEIAGIKLSEEATEDRFQRTSNFLKDYCETRGLRYEYHPRIRSSPSPSPAS